MQFNRRMFVGGGLASAGLLFSMGDSRAQDANTIRIARPRLAP